MISSKTLDFEFSKVRPFGQNLLNLLGLEEEAGKSKIKYNQFVHQLLEDGLLNFFQKYPVLGRLLATALDFWVEATAEFIQRLAQDRGAIEQTFSSITSNKSQDRDLETLQQPQNTVFCLPSPDREESNALGKVSEIQTSLSDPHNQGHTVILLTFESGLKLVYKPKDLGLEAAWNQFLYWCNHHSQLLELKVIQVLNQQDYGWVEYVEHQPCKDEAAIKRFYQRAGMLLCLLYTLRGNNCHHENLIASGEHLVLIDMETLLHHEANLLENSPLAQAFESDSMQKFWGSVLRTGLLPRWSFNLDKSIAYDISGLGSIPDQQSRKVRRWQNINTDEMHLRDETVPLPFQKNVPLLGDRALSPNDYQGQLCAGFEQMYRFLMAHKESLLTTESPLTLFQHQQIRFVFRTTRIYFTILQQAWAPDYLKNGADYSIELERLSYAYLEHRFSNRKLSSACV